MALWSAVTGDEVGGANSQAAGRIVATVALVAFLAWMGWLRATGVGRLGRPAGWVVAVVAVLYLVPAGLMAMFGPRGIGWFFEVPPGELAGGLGMQATVGIAEEALFRGLLLLILVQAWGRTRPGALRAALLTALVFGLLHGTAALAGVDVDYVLANLVGAAASGFWWAAITLAYGSIWPAVLIHAATNAAVLAIPYAADALGPLRAVVVETPWILLGLWLLLDERRFPRCVPVIGRRLLAHN